VSAAAEPRPAATVVMLRDSPAGPELLMVRRTRGASFMADAYVFPGGRVEPEDGEGEAAFATAAARELREEAGIHVEPASLVKFAHWITPTQEPKRFDAHFFVAALPAGEVAQHDTVETVDVLWATAAEVLRQYAAGALKLPPPTIRNLEDLAPHGSVDAVLAWARRRVIAPILPKLAPIGATIAIVFPWDAEYPSLPGDGLPIAADHPLATGASRLVLTEGRWWGQKP
jgi:8-oxo-dGTP pyrophosphatase MutT (NUDIX family)